MQTRDWQCCNCGLPPSTTSWSIIAHVGPKIHIEQCIYIDLLYPTSFGCVGSNPTACQWIARQSFFKTNVAWATPWFVEFKDSLMHNILTQISRGEMSVAHPQFACHNMQSSTPYNICSCTHGLQGWFHLSNVYHIQTFFTKSPYHPWPTYAPQNPHHYLEGLQTFCFWIDVEICYHIHKKP